MKRQQLRRPAVWGVLFGLSAIILAGCGGGGQGNATGPSSDPPVISNLVGSFLPDSCATGSGTGTTRLLSFDYSDSDGNVSGGLVQITATFNPRGSTSTFTFSVPSDTVTLTGRTSGTIRATVCVRFGTATSFSEGVSLLDAAQNVSNTLVITTDRPAGAPEVPRSAAGAAYGPR